MLQNSNRKTSQRYNLSINYNKSLINQKIRKIQSGLICYSFDNRFVYVTRISLVFIILEAEQSLGNLQAS